RLRMADPDRQELVALSRLQENDRLLADQIEAHAVDLHLLHRATFSDGSSGLARQTSPVRAFQNLPNDRPPNGKSRSLRLAKPASSTEASSVMVTGSGVIHSRTRASLECTRPATARIRSRSVKMPIIRPKSETTTAPTPRLVIFSAASPIVSEGSTVKTSFVMT